VGPGPVVRLAAARRAARRRAPGGRGLLQAIGELESLRNRQDISPNEFKAALKAVDDVYNVSRSHESRTPEVDHIRQAVHSYDEFPALKFRIEMVHQ